MTISSLSHLLNGFKDKRALVVGDLMLDEYIFGRAVRISQEAPVMVVRQESTRAVPGGAANVAANMVAMGAKATLVGVIGSDDAGRQLASALAEGGISTSGLVQDSGRITTRKTRIVANHSHQVLRIDHEDLDPVSQVTEDTLMEQFIAEAAPSDVVLISDYLKGGVTKAMISKIIAHAKEINLPVVANPKPQSLKSYRGATLISLNRYEASTAAGREEPMLDSDAEGIAAELRASLGVENLVITLGASGMAVSTASGQFSVPAVRVEVYDEAGAGDTVIATVALGVACGSVTPALFRLAAQTAGCVVQRVGVATPTAEDLEMIRSIPL